MREGTVTAGTSVPHISYPLLYEGIGGLLSLVSANGIHLRCIRAQVGRNRPGAGVWGSLWSQGVRTGDFAGGPLGAQVPSLARGVPTPSLDPRRTHASPYKRPSHSMGLGHMAKGCEELASVAANPQTPPSSHHHCEDPPVLPSVKGSPFTDGRTGGRPPGDGFCPSQGWLVSGQ